MLLPPLHAASLPDNISQRNNDRAPTLEGHIYKHALVSVGVEISGRSTDRHTGPLARRFAPAVALCIALRVALRPSVSLLRQSHHNRMRAVPGNYLLLNYHIAEKRPRVRLTRAYGLFRGRCSQQGSVVFPRKCRAASNLTQSRFNLGLMLRWE